MLPQNNIFKQYLYQACPQNQYLLNAQALQPQAPIYPYFVPMNQLPV